MLCQIPAVPARVIFYKWLFLHYYFVVCLAEMKGGFHIKFRQYFAGTVQSDRTEQAS
jgi:hypothetical protein